MRRLSPNFIEQEFACHHCGACIEIDQKLLDVLETLRAGLGVLDPVAVVIMSGYRCPAHNKAVGGAPNSQHMYGTAADIRVTRSKTGRPVPPKQVADWLEEKYPNSLGLGRYKGWTHVDVRPHRARWGRN